LLAHITPGTRGSVILDDLPRRQYMGILDDAEGLLEGHEDTARDAIDKLGSCPG
jgi:hypothetical protein